MRPCPQAVLAGSVARLVAAAAAALCPQHRSAKAGSRFPAPQAARSWVSVRAEINFVPSKAALSGSELQILKLFCFSSALGQT